MLCEELSFRLAPRVAEQANPSPRVLESRQGLQHGSGAGMQLVDLRNADIGYVLLPGCYTARGCHMTDGICCWSGLAVVLYIVQMDGVLGKKKGMGNEWQDCGVSSRSGRVLMYVCTEPSSRWSRPCP